MRALSVKQQKTLVAVFFIVLLAIGLLTVKDYGAPYDELVEIPILTSNLIEYAQRFGASGYYGTLPGTPISQSLEQDHGICAYYALAPILPGLGDDLGARSTVWSGLTWLWFMLGCLSVYGFLRETGASRGIACIGVLLLYLSPRFFAEGHYNNKDVILLVFYLATLWTGARLLKKPTFPRALLFSLFGAMATNTKIIGVLPWAMTALFIAVRLWVHKGWTPRLIVVALTTAISYLGFWALLTPAMWSDPAAFIAYLINNAVQFTRFEGVVVFRGATFTVPDNTLPAYYVPYYLLVSVPLYTVALAAAGQIFSLGDCVKRRDSQGWLMGVVSLCWLLPLVYAAIGRPLMYNGWRHFYFVYAGFVLMAGYGLQRLWALAKSKARPAGRRLVAIGMALGLLVTSAGIIVNHPYEFSYYNPLIKRDALGNMDMDTWDVSAADALKRLYASKERNPALPLVVGCPFIDIQNGRFKLSDDIKKVLQTTVNPNEPYLYYNAQYAYVFGFDEPPLGYHELFRVKSYGSTVGVMYEQNQ